VPPPRSSHKICCAASPELDTATVSRHELSAIRSTSDTCAHVILGRELSAASNVEDPVAREVLSDSKRCCRSVRAPQSAASAKASRQLPTLAVELGVAVSIERVAIARVLVCYEVSELCSLVVKTFGRLCAPRHANRVRRSGCRGPNGTRAWSEVCWARADRWASAHAAGSGCWSSSGSWRAGRAHIGHTNAPAAGASPEGAPRGATTRAARPIIRSLAVTGHHVRKKLRVVISLRLDCLNKY